MARAQHPGNQQAPWLALQSPYFANFSYCRVLWTDAFLRTAYSAEGNLSPFSSGLGLGLPYVNSPLKPPGLSHRSEEQQQQPSVPRGSPGLGLLGVPSAFTSTSFFRPALPVLTQCPLLGPLGPCLPCLGREDPALPSLTPAPRDVLASGLPAPGPSHTGLFSLSPPCSSLVQIGKNQAAPAPSQRAPGPGPSPGKDNRRLSLLICSGEQGENRDPGQQE